MMHGAVIAKQIMAKCSGKQQKSHKLLKKVMEE